MRLTSPLAVICTSELGWKTVRARWVKALPLEFEDVRFFNPESFEKSHKAWGSRSLREMLNARAAARAAVASGAERILIATDADAGLLPRGPKYFVYMDATLYQARWIYAHRPPTLRMKQRVNKLREFARRGHTFFCMSRLAAHGANQEYKVPLEQIVLLPPPVDTDLFRPKPGKWEVGNGLRVVFIGGQFERKGGDVLLKVAAEPEFAGCEFCFVTRFADHHCRESTAARADSLKRANAQFHTNLQPGSAELVSLIQSCDLLCLPTRADAHSLAALECHACGLPVIIRNMGAISEFVEDGVNGWVIDRSEPDDVKTALMRYLSEPSLLGRHGSAGLGRVRRDNALSVHAKSIRRAVEK